MRDSEQDAVSQAMHFAKNKETAVRLLEHVVGRTTEPERRKRLLELLTERKKELEKARADYELIAMSGSRAAGQR